MKCKNCGADIKAGSKFCEFCGSQISLDMQKEMEQLNKAGCPKCGSSNIKFEREKQAEVKGKKGTSIVRATVGVCNDCGYTWETHDNKSESKSNKLWLWILGWIFIFPVPLTILMLRNKDIKNGLKYTIITIGWIVYLCIGLGNDSTTTQENEIISNEIESIESNINTEDGSVLFIVKSNSSENAKYELNLTNNNGYNESQSITILNNGEGYTSEFSDNGKPLKGEYTVNIINNNGEIISNKNFNFD